MKSPKRQAYSLKSLQKCRIVVFEFEYNCDINSNILFLQSALDQDCTKKRTLFQDFS